MIGPARVKLILFERGASGLAIRDADAQILLPCIDRSGVAGTRPVKGRQEDLANLDYVLLREEYAIPRAQSRCDCFTETQQETQQ